MKQPSKIYNIGYLLTVHLKLLLFPSRRKSLRKCLVVLGWKNCFGRSYCRFLSEKKKVVCARTSELFDAKINEA